MRTSHLLLTPLLRHCVLAAWIGGPIALMGGQGCTLADDYCDVFCECERCNDRQLDDCQISVAAAFDVADVYDCTVEADDFYTCAVQSNDCDDADFSVDDSCNNEREDLYDCVDKASDLIGSNSAAAQQAAQQAVGPGGGATVCACSCTCASCTFDGATRTCQPGEVGCESCDVVCNEACVFDPMCGAFVSSTGQCAP